MNNNKLRVCVIEDEDVPRNSLINLINSSDDMQVVCEAASVDESIRKIKKFKPELIFMDIILYGGDAFMIIDNLITQGIDIPPIILNTGHSEFELSQRTFNEYRDYVIMILKKPLLNNWPDVEFKVLKEYYKFIYNKDTDINNERILIKTKSKTSIINVKDIMLIKIPAEYKGKARTYIFTKEGEYEINKTLSMLEYQLPSYFIRINRFEIINGKLVCEFDHTEQSIKLNGLKEKLNLGTSYKENFLHFLDSI